MDPWHLLSMTTICLLPIIHKNLAQVREVTDQTSTRGRSSSLGIDCFECHSIDGNNPDCEDDFGPVDEKESYLKRNCKVGYLQFRAHYCVKIKGTKPNGQSIILRTCSFDNWGTVCGSVIFEHGDEDNKEKISGCLETCDYDGCNNARTLKPRCGLVFLTAVCSAFLISKLRWIWEH